MFCFWRLVEVLSDLEVDVIAELRPIDVLQEAEVMLFFTRYTSDLLAFVCPNCHG